MCGIAGIVRLDGGPAEASAVERMIGALDHRGPDGSGLSLRGGACLGHRRLSILDPTDAGAQPMHRGRLTLVHNGEVYNYLELADELRRLGEQITTGTDTEVILAAYDRWGVDAVARFNGMFAFALWDEERRRLVLARDRMGVKPLYVRRTARSLGFASEPRAFVAASPLDPDDRWVPLPRLGVMHDFLTRGWTDHSDESFIDGVTAIPAAHVLVVEPGGERLVRYWSVPELASDDRPAASAADARGDQQLVEEFAAMFDSSVRLRLRSDVSIGTCLSGGLDSSSIVMTVSALLGGDATRDHEQAPRLGFHARFPADGVDESRYADLVARKAGIGLIHTTPPGTPLLASVLPVLRAQGEPFASGSIIAQHAVMAAAQREGIKVLLDGQGADELVGGYDLHLGIRSAGLLAAGRPGAAAHELRAQVARGPWDARDAMGGMLHAALPRRATELIRSAAGGRLGIRCVGPIARETSFIDRGRQPGTLLASRLWHELTTSGLPALLRYEDRNSMAFGIEARVPFLDYRLVELAVRLPDRLRVEHGVTKVVLRRAVGPRLPARVAARRDKVGFEVPQRSWLAAGMPEVRDLVRDGQVVARGWVSPAEVERVLDDGLAGGRGTDHLWRLFIVEAWLRLVWPDATPVGGAGTWQAAIESEHEARPRALLA